MQLLPCPFCGNRDEREFFYAGEMGKERPDTLNTVSDAQWAEYRYATRNSKGVSQEIWMHLSCSEVFALERDTISMQVVTVTTLRQIPT